MSDADTSAPINTAASSGPIPSATVMGAGCGPRAVTCVFVDEVTALPIPAETAQQRLRACLQTDRGLRAVATAAFRDGQAVLLRAGVAGLTGPVMVQVVQDYLRGKTTVVPVRWVTSGPTGEAFPAMDANLECEPADDLRSRLALRGSYRPPTGQAGAALDTLVLHRAAGATAQALLVRVGRIILSAHPEATDARSDRDPDRLTRATPRSAEAFSRPPPAGTVR